LKVTNVATSPITFVMDGQPTAKLDVFVTKKPGSLYVTFIIELPCSDATNEGRTGAKILARGEGMYDAEAKKFVVLAGRGEQLVYNLSDGTEKMLENIVLVVGIAVLGHRTVGRVHDRPACGVARRRTGGEGIPA